MLKALIRTAAVSSVLFGISFLLMLTFVNATTAATDDGWDHVSQAEVNLQRALFLLVDGEDETAERLLDRATRHLRRAVSNSGIREAGANGSSSCSPMIKDALDLASEGKRSLYSGERVEALERIAEAYAAVLQWRTCMRQAEVA